MSVLALFSSECVLCSVSQKGSILPCVLAPCLACMGAARAGALSRVNGFTHAGKAFNGGTGKDRWVPQQMRSRPWERLGGLPGRGRCSAVPTVGWLVAWLPSPLRTPPRLQPCTAAAVTTAMKPGLRWSRSRAALLKEGTDTYAPCFEKILLVQIVRTSSTSKRECHLEWNGRGVPRCGWPQNRAPYTAVHE